VSEIKRLHSLDAARGIAALAVVVWHWQHVYMIGGGKLEDRSIQPFYDILFPLYHSGWLAVEFFFTLSGFVFFWLYGQKLADRTLGMGSFWLARFSRLYPLHLVTLLVIAVMQVALMSNGHQSFIYSGTNWTNFGLNLLFLQHFVPGGAWTFNGPEWSVGVEIILYVIFSVYCLVLKPNWRLPLLALVCVGIWYMGQEWTLGRGIVGFFAGGLAYEAWRRLRDLPWMSRAALPIILAVAAAWIYTIIEARFHPLASSFDTFGLRGWWVVEMIFRLVLVPVTVTALALHESHGAKFWQKLSPIGDLTYGLYLWHFPLQLAMACAVLLAGAPLAPMQSPLGMVIYMTVLIALAWASYRWIERPAQIWIRSRVAPRPVLAERPA
jgi:peptidoglycan/LPS O-acetylase OafA/YrhL